MPIEWNFFRNKVQSGMPHGQFLSGRSTIIAAGPPNIVALGNESAADATGSQAVFPIGLTQSMSINQSLAVQRFFEIGSVRQYFITGHNITNFGLNRTLYHGPNLLRALYAYYSSNTAGTLVTYPSINALLKKYAAMPLGVNQHSVSISPGEQNFFINMTSDLFSQPVGLLLLLRDQDELTYGMAYAENCYVDNYALSTDASSIIMTEGVNIQCERIVPIGSGVVSLITTLDDDVIREAEDGGDITAVTEA